MVVRARLAADSRGRDILLRLATAPSDAAEELRQYLFAEAGPVGLGTLVTGGTVDRLVNIAKAEVVNIAGPRSAPPAAHQLPPDIIDFTNRIGEVDRIVRRALVSPVPGVPIVCTIVGGGGVGKTALAVHVAHRLAPTFPDAQLYVNLGGAQARPASPHEVLGGLLRALGAEPDRIPDDLDERSSLYRAMLSGRRSVVLLDNAAGSSQIRPLLPGGPAAVIVTSREPLADLEGADHIALDVLSPDTAVQLLSRIVGAERQAAEPEASLALAASCGNLPLALRIAAARLVSRPQWRLSRMVARLEDESRRLEELEVGELAVRASFQLSYDGLEPLQRRAFRLATLVPDQTFTSWAIGALLDADLAAADDIVDRLVDLRLLEIAREDATGQMRYQFHDLVRLFARERLAEEELPVDERAAIDRLLGAYLALARRGLYALSPHSKRDPDVGQAIAWPPPDRLVDDLLTEPYTWFTVEHAGLVGAVAMAYERDLHAYVYELAEQLHYYFRVRSHLGDWQRTHELALASSRAVGDRRAEAWTLRNLGNALQDQGRLADAGRSFEQAAAIFLDIGNTLGSAATLCNLGELRMVQGRFRDAVDYLAQSLPGWRQAHDQVGEAYTLDNLGLIHGCQGELDTAERYLDESGAKFSELHDRFGEAHSRRRRADILRERGDLEQADIELQLSRAIFADLASDIGDAWVAVTQSRILVAREELSAAIDLATAAVRTFQDHGDLRAASQAMVDLGTALIAARRHNEAKAVLHQARERLTELGDEFGGAQATYQSGRAAAAAGETSIAIDDLRLAATMFEHLPAPSWGDRSRDRLAELGA